MHARQTFGDGNVGVRGRGTGVVTGSGVYVIETYLPYSKYDGEGLLM